MLLTPPRSRSLTPEAQSRPTRPRRAARCCCTSLLNAGIETRTPLHYTVGRIECRLPWNQRASRHRPSSVSLGIAIIGISRRRRARGAAPARLDTDTDNELGAGRTTPLGNTTTYYNNHVNKSPRQQRGNDGPYERTAAVRRNPPGVPLRLRLGPTPRPVEKYFCCSPHQHFPR